MFRFLSRRGSITQMAFSPPQAQAGRAGLALVVIVKNEARHIQEWAQFHLDAGVRHIYLYDNGSSDETCALISAVAGKRVTIIPWNQKLRDGRRGGEIHSQVMAYAHATCNFGGYYRWFGYIDIDEFLVPKQAHNLDDALAHLTDCQNISLPWHMFGRCGHKAVPEGGVLRNYTKRHPDPIGNIKGLCNFKMIVDPCHVRSLKVHSIDTDDKGKTCNDRGQVFTHGQRHLSAFYSADHIQLNHYYTRSDEELQEKLARGAILTTASDAHARRVMRKVEAIEAQDMDDRTALAFLERIGQVPY